MINCDSDYITALLSNGLRLALIMSAPMLIAAVAVGILVSLFQAATQIQEQTLSFVPKIIATFLAVMFCAPWIATTVTHLTISMLQSIPHLRIE